MIDYQHQEAVSRSKMPEEPPNGKPDSRSQAQGRDLWVRAGQVVLFILAIGLLGLHTLRPLLVTWWKFQVTIDTTTLVLLLFIVLAAVLPKVEKIIIGKDQVEIDVASSRDAVQDAQRAAGTTNTSLPAEQRSLALIEAREDPLTSVELSRRRLAQALTDLARGKGVPIEGAKYD